MILTICLPLPLLLPLHGCCSPCPGQVLESACDLILAWDTTGRHLPKVLPQTLSLLLKEGRRGMAAAFLSPWRWCQYHGWQKRNVKNTGLRCPAVRNNKCRHCWRQEELVCPRTCPEGPHWGSENLLWLCWAAPLFWAEWTSCLSLLLSLLCVTISPTRQACQGRKGDMSLKPSAQCLAQQRKQDWGSNLLEGCKET